MKKEISEKKHVVRERVKELESKGIHMKVDVERLTQQIQGIQQRIAQINTERLKLMGAIEELKRS